MVGKDYPRPGFFVRRTGMTKPPVELGVLSYLFGVQSKTRLFEFE